MYHAVRDAHLHPCRFHTSKTCSYLPQVEYNSAEEALDATGWLADRPPQAHGETGHAFYTVQVGGRRSIDCNCS